MKALFVTLTVVFGLIFLISSLLFGASFSRAERKRHPFLTKFDGKKPLLLIVAIISGLLGYASNAGKDLLPPDQPVIANKAAETPSRPKELETLPPPTSTIEGRGDKRGQALRFCDLGVFNRWGNFIYGDSQINYRNNRKRLRSCFSRRSRLRASLLRWLRMRGCRGVRYRIGG